jgi:4-hydroxy-2-oxoheptanedioate aldolase
MLRPNPLRQAIAARRRAIGAWLFMAAPSNAELLAGVAFDALVIDQEHGPGGLESVVAQLRAAGSPQTTAPALLTRAPDCSMAAIKPLLDAGAEGIFAPNVESADQVAALVEAMHYPPRGRRGLHYTVSRAAGWGRHVNEYADHAERELLTVAMIESAAGVAAIPQMAAHGGIDMFFVGPLDLSASLGQAGDYAHPAFREALDEAERRILESDAALGGAIVPGQGAQALFSRGYSFVTVGADAGFLRSAALQALALAGADRDG